MLSTQPFWDWAVYRKVLNIPSGVLPYSSAPVSPAWTGGDAGRVNVGIAQASHNQAELNLCTSTAMMQELTAHGIEREWNCGSGGRYELFHPELACQSVST